MTPYPAYKPTELPWLPKIPESWNTVKVKYAFKERSEKGYPAEPLLAATQNHGVIPKRLYETRTVTAQKDLHLLKLVKVGDFVISLRSFQGGIEYAYYQGIISPAYTVMVPVARFLQPMFFKYLAKSKIFIKLLQTCVTGIREGQNIDYETLRRNAIPVPPPDEQAQIVRYLDSMTAKINKLIRAKKRICDLIFEEIIQCANEYINNKYLPRYRLKNIIKLVADEIVRDNDMLYTPIGVLNRGRGIFQKKQLLGKDLGDSIFFHVFPGDMIFSGQFAWEGAVAILQNSEEGCIASHRYPLARAIDPVFLRLPYLWAFFQTKYGDMLLNIHSHGAAGRNRPLNIVHLLREPVPIPSLDEQSKIEKLFLRLQEARKLAVNYSVKLQEYKNSLISSVVTGQVDIRNIPVDDFDPADLVSETPDEPEEENAADESEE